MRGRVFPRFEVMISSLHLEFCQLNVITRFIVCVGISILALFYAAREI